MLRKTLLPLLLILASLWLWLPLRSSSAKNEKGFSLEAISALIPFNASWEGHVLTTEERQEVEKALSQPYRDLGSGGQCFTFVSADGNYVIKFFKQKKFTLPNWMERFPLPLAIDWLKEKKRFKGEQKRDRVFAAFKLCFDSLPNETGLLYLHLNPTQNLHPQLSLCDAKGNVHLLPLDQLSFALQRKAELAYNVFEQLMTANQIDEAKHALHELLALNLTFYQKGLRNRDTNFRSNCGFIGSRAILIDVGRVVYLEEIKNPKRYKKEFIQITAPLRSFLDKKYPELLPVFDQFIADLK